MFTVSKKSLQASRNAFSPLNNSKRTIVFTAIAAFGDLLIGKDVRLADAMEKGNLHNKNGEYEHKMEQRTQERLSLIHI